MGTPRALWPLVWAVLQLGWRPGWLLDAPSRPWSPLTFSPARLTVPEGANATFTCSFSSKPEHFVLNWYRMSPSNQTDKLAAFPEDRSQPGRDRRFHVTPLPGGQRFHMSIVAAQRNDSGVYFCGAIYLPPKTQINESRPAELTVTEGVVELPTERPSPPPRPEGQLQGLVTGITSALLGVLLLLTWVLAAVFLWATRGTLGARRPVPPSLPKEDSSAGPARTVDYGELDFQWREKTPEPPAPCVPEQTEYATIVFPGRPGSPGRRASADSPQGPWPLRTEDGHCSWPL
ncbi:programmed cell death protein 1 isoform X2 [Physeter macrocephalus]|uniref:Programmed cell death protein 1 isoform X2 n=1 Tax=Physeter macrocephalus TaxID=9755 RepID=A0A2Y9FP84_PHYMC|nr:programmed cell death protein 1 isoform X2 [Physeter catodon]|eukprot:XP_007127885.1 programmed cell death protein 1 isoform X2 [Physeter catodon]